MVLVAIMMFLKSNAQGDTFTIKIVSGPELTMIVPFVVEQRIEFFKNYPFLYRGNQQEEETYVGWFISLPHSALAVACYNDIPVGFVGGTSFVHFNEHFKGSVELFNRAHLKPDAYFYISEVIIIPRYREDTLIKKLFNALEDYARNRGFTNSCFVYEVHDHHPLMPKDYKLLSYQWRQLGYAQSSLNITYRWLTFQPDGTTQRQDHELNYWLKSFDLAKEEL
jgi:GNAT superfamily N-acetyltransferase